ncbi:hypothetical protein [Alcanivorax sp.]|uniref:hypothetical protein n=1 Tax=Alcanivorax sp. TaxID=1872427 RepID=UPI00258C79EB|nr:hypothetical protein [Alcanivorax sp.]
MKLKKINLVLASVAAGFLALQQPAVSYAGDDGDGGNNSSSNESQNNDNGSNNSSSNESQNNDNGGNNSSSEESSEKITICHIPPGNPDKLHTIRISSDAWEAHKAHGDYMGACLPSATVIGCSKTYHSELSKVVRDYVIPEVIDVSDLDADRELREAVENCVDKDKGEGDDSSDKEYEYKVHHHDGTDSTHKVRIIKSCKNKSRDDSSEKYRDKLKEKSENHEHHNAHEPIVVTDSSLDDDDVRKAYNECLDSSKGAGKEIKSWRYASGTQVHVLLGCKNDSSDSSKKYHDKLKEKLKKHWEGSDKKPSHPIYVDNEILKDATIYEATGECLDPGKGGGGVIPKDPSDDDHPKNKTEDLAKKKHGHIIKGTAHGKRLNWREVLK